MRCHTRSIRVPSRVPSLLDETGTRLDPDVIRELSADRCVCMKTAAEYRVMAEKCFKWARNACMGEVRETYLQLAQFWLDVASKLDGPPRSKA